MTELPQTHDPGDRKFVTAMARGLLILKAFGRSDLWLTNQELAARTGLPRSTVSRAAYTLVEMQFLSVHPVSQAYKLGPAVLRLASNLADWEWLRQALRPVMEDLASVTGAAVGAAHLDGDEMAYFEYCKPSAPVMLSLGAGSRVPILGTAAGRSLMAALDEQGLTRLRVRIAQNPQTAEQFDRQATAARAEAKQSGHNASFGEWQLEINAIAASLYIPVAAQTVVITVAGPSMTLSKTRFQEDIAAELATAMAIMRLRVTGQH